MRARPAFFVFCVHLFTISPQHAYDQRIAGEGFTFTSFTESSPISSPQPTHYERVRSKVKGEHTKSELGEAHTRSRRARGGVSARGKAAKSEGENREGETKGREVGNDSFESDGGNANSVRALEQVRNEDEKVPSFFDEPPHFFEKDVAFSQ